MSGQETTNNPSDTKAIAEPEQPTLQADAPLSIIPGLSSILQGDGSAHSAAKDFAVDHVPSQEPTTESRDQISSHSGTLKDDIEQLHDFQAPTASIPNSTSILQRANDEPAQDVQVPTNDFPIASPAKTVKEIIQAQHTTTEADQAKSELAPTSSSSSILVESEEHHSRSEGTLNHAASTIKNEDVTMEDSLPTAQISSSVMQSKSSQIPIEPSSTSHLRSGDFLPTDSTLAGRIESDDTQMIVEPPSATQAHSGEGAFMAFDPDFIETARANRDDLEAEFAEDSDPAMSDDSTESDDSDSDDSSSDDDSDYGSVILDPAEAARLLMEASPEDEGRPSGPPRTANEQQEKPLPIPSIPDITELPLTELGHISHIIPRDNCVVVQATIHHNHNVLQPGTALCLENKTLIRPISDTIAQVQEPYYISYYTSPAEITDLGIEEGMKVYYPDHPDYRTFVFYEELRKQKFTDASNINDEEVDDREIEFSDDEQEAAYKKAKKEERRKQYGGKQEDDEESVQDTQQQHGRRRGGRGGGNRGRPQRGGRGGWQDYDAGHAPAVPAYAPPQPSNTLDYGDDAGEGDGYYKKLQRPDDYGTWQSTARPDLQQPPSSGGGSHEGAQGQYVPPASYSNIRVGNESNQRGNHRGRRGNRGNRGQHRGGGSGYTHNHNNNSASGSWQQHNMPPAASPIPPPMQQMNFQPNMAQFPQQQQFPGFQANPEYGVPTGYNGMFTQPQQVVPNPGVGIGGMQQQSIQGFQNFLQGLQNAGGAPYGGYQNQNNGGYQQQNNSGYQNQNNAGYQNQNNGSGGGGGQ